MNFLLVHWKSNVSGILTVVLATIGPLLALPNIQTFVSPKTLMILGGVSAIGKVWVSLIQQDAGVVVATTPSNPEPHAEPAHEVPNEPTAVPVADAASKSSEVKP